MKDSKTLFFLLFLFLVMEESLHKEEEGEGLNGETRVCKKCNSLLPLLSYGVNQRLTSGRVYLKHTCKSCRSEQEKTRKELRKTHRMPSSGVDCPICERRTGRPVLDHDHKTGLFRGWICNDCNNALGKFEDSEEVLQRAIRYLLGSSHPSYHSAGDPLPCVSCSL